MKSGLYLQLLLRRKWIILSTLVVTLAVVGLSSYFMTPAYSASATIRIAHGQGGAASYTELMYADRLTNTYVQLLKTRPFLEQVIQRLSLQTTPDALAASIKVEPLANTELIRVRAESPSASQAVGIADALAALFVEQSQQAYNVQGRGLTQILQERVNAAGQRLTEDRATLERLSQERQSTPQPDPALLTTIQEVNGRILQEEQSYMALLGDYDRARAEELARMGNVTVVELAALPQLPSRPRPALYLALGALLGLVGGVGLALLMERLDGRALFAKKPEGRGGNADPGIGPLHPTSGGVGELAPPSRNRKVFRH